MGRPPPHQWDFMDLRSPPQCSRERSLRPRTRVTHHVHRRTHVQPGTVLFHIGLAPPFFVLFWHWQRARRTVVRLCLLDTKNGEGRHQQGTLDRWGAHAMRGQDRLQSVKPPAMVLLLLPLPVAHADRGEEGPYLGRLHAPIPHLVLVHVYRLPPPPRRSPFAADARARRWI